MVNSDQRKEDLFNSALTLRNEGDFKGACEKFSALIEEYPDFPAPYIFKGNLLKRIGRLEEAIQFAKKAVELKPQLEIASLVLFHSLWEKEEKITAFKEMKRFILAGGKSDDYVGIIAELLEKEEEPLLSKAKEIDEIMKGKKGNIVQFPESDRTPEDEA